MLNNKFVPTRLIDPADRPPLIIAEAGKPPRFRALYLLRLFLRWVAVVLWLGLKGKLTRGEYARQFRKLLEDMGGLWIKVGQLLSFRIDMFSMEFCRELSKLQGQVRGFPPEAAKRIVEEELAAPLERYFDHFEDMPFAAASIGQIHRAHLREEGVWVAVKVQRPYLAAMFSLDMAMIEWLVRFLRMFSIRPFMRWEEGLRELRQIMNEEMDCRYEDSALRRMRKSLRKQRIYVPKVFSRYNRRRILVLEFIHAVLMADYIQVADADPAKLAAWLQENNINPRLVARRLIHSLFRQLFEDNLYHGDLHPGNILLLRNNRIALVDFGAVNFTENEYLQKYHLFFSALATRDYAKAADTAFLLGGSLPRIDIEPVKEKLVEALRAWGARALVRDLPYHEKSLDNAFVAVAKIMVRYKCEVKWTLLRMRRASATLDASIVSLYPDLDITRVVQKYLRQAEKRALWRTMGAEMLPRFLKSVATAMEISENTYEQGLYQSSVIRRQAQVFGGTTSKFAYFFAVLFAQVAAAQLLAGIVFTIAFLYHHHRDWIEWLMGDQLSRVVQVFPRLNYQVWILILIVNFYFFLTSVSLQRRFAKKTSREERRLTQEGL